MIIRAKACFSSHSYSLPSVEILSFQMICYELTSTCVLIYSLNIQIYFLSYIKHTYSFFKCVESHWTISVIWIKHFNSLSLRMTARVFFKKCKSEAVTEPAMAPGFPLRKASFQDHEDTRSPLCLLPLPSSLSCLSCNLLFLQAAAYGLCPGCSVWKFLPTVTLRVHTPYKSLLKWYLNYLP